MTVLMEMAGNGEDGRRSADQLIAGIRLWRAARVETDRITREALERAAAKYLGCVGSEGVREGGRCATALPVRVEVGRCAHSHGVTGGTGALLRLDLERPAHG
jgi:hypothetical protein